MDTWRQSGAGRRRAAAWAGVAMVAIAGAVPQRDAPANREAAPRAPDARSAMAAPIASALRRIGRVDLSGAETICYDAPSNMIFATGSRGVSMIHLGDGSTATHVRTLSLTEKAEARSGMNCSISHVALGAGGVGAACIVPNDIDAIASCRRLLAQSVCRALSRAVASTGISNPINSVMIEMTMSSSTSVKAPRARRRAVNSNQAAASISFTSRFIGVARYRRFRRDMFRVREDQFNGHAPRARFAHPACPS